MAHNATPKAQPRERRKARTIEEQIAELQAKKEAQEKKAKESAAKQLAAAVASRNKAEAKFRQAEAKVAALRETLGISEDVPEAEPFDEG